MTDPLTPPEKHTGEGEERALTKAVSNATAPQQGNNSSFLARRSLFLDRGPLNGCPLSPLSYSRIGMTLAGVAQNLQWETPSGSTDLALHSMAQIN
jgi:hypothetical protein